MGTNKTYQGPVTGRKYDLAGGDRIDPAAEGLGYSGDKKSPNPVLDGRELYRRIFIRLRTPYETLTCRPIEDGKDFASRVSIIENWFNSIVRKGNYVLTFEVEQVTDEQANEIQNDPDLT